jgi:anaerobic selenocysteine-containing dehydrogenase
MHKDVATCFLCEANCGIEVEHDGREVRAVRGDRLDPLSRGYICPKAHAIAELQADPDRVRRPQRRRGDRWEEVGWDEALDDVGRRLRAVRETHGRHAVGVYLGNPTVHSYTAVLGGLPLLAALRTRNRFSANSLDTLPRLLASFLLYGSQALLPVPDVDRTRFLLVLGANPAVSNGSVMTAPDVKRRLRAIRERGGRVVVVDPRRTETAELVGEHVFLRPGTDALFLAAMLHVVFAEGLVRLGHLEGHVGGIDALARRVAGLSPERVASAVGVDPAVIRGLARDFAREDAAACYGRMGTSTQQHGALASVLVDALNLVTGHVDREGGSMFATPAVDLVALAERVGRRGSFARYRSRVRGLPEMGGELPIAALADEIETPGAGQLRALVTHAGNPVLSAPNGRRLDRALASLDFMVSIDVYRNETTRHAHYILPPTFGLEREHYPLVFGALSIRNGAKLAPPILEKPAGALHDYEILGGLAARVAGLSGPLARAADALVRAASPPRLLDVLLRTGPRRLSRAALLDAEHGVDLGPLESCLVARLGGRRVDLAPPALDADWVRLEALADAARAPGSLVLIGRRQLRGNNSWMHNAPSLAKGPARCTLLVHPDDASARGLVAGGRARLEGRVGAIDVTVEPSDEVMPGVVSLPHGFGHDRPGVALAVAGARPGVSVNDVTDDALVDEVSGVSVLSGVPVIVTGLA